MGQITATRNLVATKVVRHAGQLQIVEDLPIKERVAKGQRCSASRRGPGIDAGATSRWNRCHAWPGPAAGALLVPGGDTR